MCSRCVDLYLIYVLGLWRPWAAPIPGERLPARPPELRPRGGRHVHRAPAPKPWVCSQPLRPAGRGHVWLYVHVRRRTGVSRRGEAWTQAISRPGRRHASWGEYEWMIEMNRMIFRIIVILTIYSCTFNNNTNNNMNRINNWMNEWNQ